MASGDGHEGDLTGHAVYAAVQVALDHQAHANAGPDPHEREGTDLTAVAVLALSQGRGVDVVLHNELIAESGPQLGDDRRLAPACQLSGQDDRLVAGIVDAGTADHRL